ncbi:hypothetical protein ABR738_22480 [Streptomyces sp. Edi4]|uniref:hypothetical protein n=1 Tax=Streptomyces sp. Edi4 TaxID=3162527 RepID=UPI003305F808
MFNRIRRAASRFSERLSERRRQRQRPPTAVCTTANHPAGSDRGVEQIPGQPQKHTEVLIGEETALIRPYLLASEQRAQQRATMLALHALVETPYCSAEVL